MHFIKISVYFTSLIPCLIPPTDDREMSERRAKRYRTLAAKNSALFLRLSPKKVDSFPEIVDLSISQPNHPITLKTFSTQNLHIRKFCSTFAL